MSKSRHTSDSPSGGTETPTPYREEAEAALKTHIQTWATCIRCPIGITATTHCLHRGQLKADLLIIGEAPGPSEDAIGEPFIGPAGRLLDHVLKLVAAKLAPLTFSVAFTNTIACFPLDPTENGNRFRLPTQDEVKSCIPRVKEYLKLMRPRMVALAGSTAQQSWKTHYQPFVDWPVATHEMHHPAYILRQGGANPTSLIFVRTVNGLTKFLHQQLRS